MGAIYRNGEPYSGASDIASAISYDHTSSGLTGDTVQEAVDELASGLAWSSGQTSASNYTTASWTQGSGGFQFSVPSSGWYYMSARFEGVSGTASAIQFQLRQNGDNIASNGIVTDTESDIWRGTMPIENVTTIVYCNVGDVITPYIHTEIAGIIVRTYLAYVRMAS